ncbi:threonine synthase-like 1 [Ruditapes philippinarum]|uniref:threonine synthase-like 1 n=1 Tax=Ruditapes philippinarum TaxID=129788 RepID=UPI00295BA93A|nr:threonine synthase-like 1 [Ruditapes philippinarum]
MILKLLVRRGCCFRHRRMYFCGSKLRNNASNVKNNIILMGSPGCGKTTVGRVLSAALGRPVLDIDDDHLETHWGMSVAQKLDEVGSDRFVEAEGQALSAFHTENHVVSLTGSNPMHDAGMSHIASTGTVVFLDVHMTDILERLERMKVNRIVGQNDGTSMADILQYRQQFYEKWYDTRVICERNESPESIAGKVLSQVQNIEAKHGYVSTRGLHMGDKGFNEVLLQGLASDGGLIVPRDETPKMSIGQLSRLVDLTYPQRAIRILEKWMDFRDLHPRTLRTAVNNAYNLETFQDANICPVRHLDRGQYVQELFHGPTASFKDVALQLMPQLFMNAVAEESKSKYLILVATSGDTGGAVLDGFSRHAGNFSANIGVLVLYPLEGISDIQREQMISYNSHLARVVGVSGSDFDFCQTSVKKAFGDHDLSQRLFQDHNVKISAANSISWGRLLPQVVYHVTSYLDLVKQKVIAMGDEIDVCVPTGNFGNILAAYYAKEMGIPIKKLICASNDNNVVADFIRSGCYDISNRRLLQTISPAIDILVSSNLERLLYSISGRDASFINSAFTQLRDRRKFDVPAQVLENIQGLFHADWCTEEECGKAMRDTLKNNGYLMDPHTSIAKVVADRFKQERPMVIASTAHPGKFAHDVLKITGNATNKMATTEMLHALDNICPKPGVHKSLLKTLEKDCVGEKSVCDANYQSIVSQIENIARNI